MALLRDLPLQPAGATAAGAAAGAATTQLQLPQSPPSTGTTTTGVTLPGGATATTSVGGIR
jgi:hypothetical protein